MVQLDNNKRVNMGSNNTELIVLNKLDIYDINKELENINKSFKNIIDSFEIMWAILFLVDFFIVYSISTLVIPFWFKLEKDVLATIIMEFIRILICTAISCVISQESHMFIELFWLHSDYSKSNIKILKYASEYLSNSLMLTNNKYSFKNKDFARDLFENYNSKVEGKKSKTIEASNLIVNQLLFRNAIDEDSLKAVKYLINNKCKIKDIKIKDDNTAVIKLKNKETIKVTEVFVRDDFKEILLYVFNSGLILHYPKYKLESTENKGE